MNNPLGTKLYYSISEVAEITDLQPYTLRAWEKEFPCLRPRRARGKNRAYKERDIGIILLIKKLLYEERYTTQGVKKKLKELSNEELENTFWEIETGEFVNNDQIKELELERDQMIKSLDLKDKDNVHLVLVDFCKKYEELCSLKYPDAPLPLEILKAIN